MEIPDNLTIPEYVTPEEISETTDKKPKSKSSKLLMLNILIFIIVMIIVGGVAGAVLLQKSSDKSNNSVSEKPLSYSPTESEEYKGVISLTNNNKIDEVLLKLKPNNLIELDNYYVILPDNWIINEEYTLDEISNLSDGTGCIKYSNENPKNDDELKLSYQNFEITTCHTFFVNTTIAPFSGQNIAISEGGSWNFLGGATIVGANFENYNVGGESIRAITDFYPSEDFGGVDKIDLDQYSELNFGKVTDIPVRINFCTKTQICFSSDLRATNFYTGEGDITDWKSTEGESLKLYYAKINEMMSNLVILDKTQWKDKIIEIKDQYNSKVNDKISNFDKNLDSGLKTAEYQKNFMKYSDIVDCGGFRWRNLTSFGEIEVSFNGSEDKDCFAQTIKAGDLTISFAGVGGSVIDPNGTENFNLWDGEGRFYKCGNINELTTGVKTGLACEIYQEKDLKNLIGSITLEDDNFDQGKSNLENLIGGVEFNNSCIKTYPQNDYIGYYYTNSADSNDYTSQYLCYNGFKNIVQTIVSDSSDSDSYYNYVIDLFESNNNLKNLLEDYQIHQISEKENVETEILGTCKTSVTLSINQNSQGIEQFHYFEKPCSAEDEESTFVNVSVDGYWEEYLKLVEENIGITLINNI